MSERIGVLDRDALNDAIGAGRRFHRAASVYIERRAELEAERDACRSRRGSALQGLAKVLHQQDQVQWV